MSSNHTRARRGLVYMSVIATLTAPAGILAKDKNADHITEPEVRYEGAPSPIAPGETQDMITSDGPAMSTGEFNQLRRTIESLRTELEANALNHEHELTKVQEGARADIRLLQDTILELRAKLEDCDDGR